MDAVGGVVVFILTWWVLLFCVLPFGLKRDETGKPDIPHLGKKLLITSGLAVVVWLAIYFIIESDLISFREMAAHAP